MTSPVADLAEAVTPDPAALEAVREAYGRGDYLHAWDLARAIGPLEAWRGPAGRVMAGRLAFNLGGDRLGTRLHLRAWREHPGDGIALTYGLRAVRARRGPLAAWEALRATPPDHPARARAEWHGLAAAVLAALRDADAAEASLARALDLDPTHPWLHVERSSVLQSLDRYDEALAAARHALDLRPWFRPGVQAVAHLLVLRDEVDEALALLAGARAHVRAGSLAAHAAGLLMQRGRPAEAIEALDEFERWSPLLETAGRRWARGLRSDARYLLGDLEGCLADAREAGGFHERIVERLEAGVEADRVDLDLPFVRQHKDTCAPASLAMIAGYWRQPVDHLELAAEICYDGTPSHAERRWAEARGWVVRPFTLTEAAARAVLARGVPFTLSTQHPSSGHLQVVAGLDGRRGTLLVRDPGRPGTTEFALGPLLEQQAASGPLAMALVPGAEAARLDGLDLPDAARRDHLHDLQRALVEHDRPRAAACLAALEADDAEHVVTLRARAALCSYDGDLEGQLAAADRLLARFPADASLRLWRLSLLEDLGRHDERRAALEAMRHDPPDPIAWQRLAGDLARDGRQHAEAWRLLRRCARFRPLDPALLATTADLLWDQGRRDEALERYRFASCQADTSEHFARCYFTAARALDRAAEALAFLRARQARLGDRSGWPARSLCWALDEVGEGDEARAALEAALARRPDDGELALFAAEVAARRGDEARAAALLEAARPRVHAGEWRRTAALAAAGRGDLPAALALWREVLEAEPLDLRAHDRVADLLTALEGPAAAAAHLEAAAARFPHHVALQRRRVEWLREVDPLGAEGPLFELIARHPADAWAQREAALLRQDQRRFDDALAHAALACELDPAAAAGWGIRGAIARAAGRTDDAAAWLRAALSRRIDVGYAIDGLLACAGDAAARRDALAWVREEALRQPSTGAALAAWRFALAAEVGPAAAIDELRAVQAARPDRWDAWVALLEALAEHGGPADGLALAAEATARFPLRAPVWLAAARLHALAADEPARLAALERAAEVDPEHGAAARTLAEALQRRGELERARRLLERAALRAPLVAANHAYLADVLWQAGDRAAAALRLERAVRLDPAYGWAWARLCAWAEPGRAEAVARDLTARRPHEPVAWVRLAEALDAGALDERLAALDRAAALDPRHVPTHDLRAELLAQAGRFDEALAACHPAAWRGEAPPVELRGRLACVWAERGDLERARAVMTAALDEAPDYGWGLRRLVGWCRDAGDDAAYLAQAERLRALDPLAPVPWGFVADARLRAGDRAGAYEALRRALDLGPDYGFGGRLLLDLALEDRRPDDGARAIAALRAAGDPAPAHAGAARFAALRGDRAAALEALAALCALAGDQAPERDLVREAHVALCEAGLAVDADRLLREACARAEVARGVAERWTERCLAARRFAEVEARLAGAADPAWRAVAGAWLEALAGREERRRARRVVRAHGPRLLAATDTWGCVGYALVTLGDHRRALACLGDWRAREGLRPWMLANYAHALRARGRDGEARAMHQHALTLAPDGATAGHAAWLAADAAALGDVAGATAHLARAGEPDHPGDAFLVALARATLGAVEAPLDAPLGPTRRAFAAARARDPSYRQDPAMRRIHTACVRRAARWGEVNLLVWLWRLLLLADWST